VANQANLVILLLAGGSSLLTLENGSGAYRRRPGAAQRSPAVRTAAINPPLICPLTFDEA
jgi:hypothetical protein